MKRKLIKTISVTLLATICFLPTAAAKKTSPIGNQIKLTKVPNVRDLGGIRAKNGQHIKSNRLIRSSALTHLSGHDKWKLSKRANVKVILDFRSKSEIKQAPDAKLHGTRYHRLSVMADPKFGVHTTAQYIQQLAAKQPNNMELFYEKMVVQPHSIKAYRSMFHYLLKQKSGAILYHCTYGKDRTGIATMLILSSLGVPKTTIMRNYLASNHYLKSTTRHEYRLMKRHTHNRKVLTNLKRSRTAKTAYLNAAYAAIYHHSGSMKHYLHTQMRLSNKDIQQLRKNYLTK